MRDLCRDLELVLTKEDHASLLRDAYRHVRAVESKVSIPVGVAEAMGWGSLDQMANDAGVFEPLM